MLVDSRTAVIAALAAAEARFGTHADARSLALSLPLPLLWTTAVRRFGGSERLRTSPGTRRRRVPAGKGSPACHH